MEMHHVHVFAIDGSLNSDMIAVRECGQYNTTVPFGETLDMPCKAGFYAQTMVIRLNAMSLLSLCDVKIYER